MTEPAPPPSLPPPATGGAPSEPSIPLGVRLAFAGISALIAGVAAEAVVRNADDGGLPTLGIFATDGDRIVLAPDACARMLRLDGGVYTICTDADGMRKASGAVTSGGWLVVGDSQVLGMGVADDETFAAYASRGPSDGSGSAPVRLINAGVPGYGVADARAQANALVPILHPDGVIFVVNQANDWDEGVERATVRTTVRGGWLLTAENAQGIGAWFWATPLSRSHLLYHGWMQLYSARPGSADPSGGASLGLGSAKAVAPITKALAAEIQAFAASHPTLPTVAVFLPADAATSEARAAMSPFAHTGSPWSDTSLRDAFQEALWSVPLLDLRPALAAPDSFLHQDYHLSPAGHARVAAALAPTLAQRLGAAQPDRTPPADPTERVP